MTTDRNRDLLPNTAALAADSTVREARVAIIRDLVAARLPLRRIGKILNRTIAQVREDLAAVPAPATGGADGD